MELSKWPKEVDGFYFFTSEDTETHTKSNFSKIINGQIQDSQQAIFLQRPYS